MKPTVVLVHGAFADSSSRDGVAGRLSARGHRVIAYAAAHFGLTRITLGCARRAG
jgi:pimeloyl-ACP methyl ester carboxylesterase